jgi:prevent-host-death family protein
MSQTTPLATVGVRVLRQEASTVLDRVKAGETIEITEHGKPIALLSPIPSSIVETWISRRLITPAKNPGTLLSVKPIKSKSRQSTQEILDYLRAEKI